MQGRGLKLSLFIDPPKKNHVAPHAGAWIETYRVPGDEFSIRVAPHAGAWIETSCISASLAIMLGRPSCRGVD